ncbi:uncharacterized protein LOC135109639 [Scylla paramamosain]|uniref:uncharacterized protein LOC135109639 n=1 Tax=Scylla paramamosain TaxID=85552 RepID=UPI003082FFF7
MHWEQVRRGAAGDSWLSVALNLPCFTATQLTSFCVYILPPPSLQQAFSLPHLPSHFQYLPGAPPPTTTTITSTTTTIPPSPLPPGRGSETRRQYVFLFVLEKLRL